MRMLALCCVLTGFATAQAQELPADLKHVPGNAIGFVHVQTAEVWKSHWFKLYRDVLPKAGAEALAVLEKRIVPSLSSIDRITAVALAPDPQRRQAQPEFAVLLHLTKPFDQKTFLGGLEEFNSDGVRYHQLRGELTVQILDKNVVMFGSLGAPAALAKRAKVSDSFKEALTIAASKAKTVVAAANPSIIPPQALAGLPPMLQPFAKAKTLMMAMDLQEPLTLEADLGFSDAEQAKDAEQALAQVRELAQMFLTKTRQELKEKLNANDNVVPIYDIEKVAEIAGPVIGLAFLKRAEEVLAGIPVTRQQAQVRLKVTVPEELSSYASSAPILIALLLPAVQKVREVAARTQDANNLKQIGIAFHSYHDAYRYFPKAAICDANGKPLLSWRVAILPFIEEQQLYEQFKLNEPWDSEHNKPLLARMPKVYQIPDQPSDSQTHYRVLVGPEKGPVSAFFRSNTDKVSVGQITDGFSNTLLVVESEDAVPWTKPDELTFDPKGALPKFHRTRQGFNALIADGSVRFLSINVPEATLRALITRNGGEVVNID